MNRSIGAFVFFIMACILSFSQVLHAEQSCAGLMFGTFGEDPVIMIMDRKADCPGELERRKILVIFEGLERSFPAHAEITLSLHQWIDEQGIYQTSILLTGRYLPRIRLYAYGRGEGDTEAKSFTEALINAKESVHELLVKTMLDGKEAYFLRPGHIPALFF